MSSGQIALVSACGQTDFGLCADIWLAASLEAHAFVPPQFWITRYSLMRDVYLPASSVRLAYYAGSPAGFSAMCGATLAGLFVHPAQWGKGIGSLLLTEQQKEQPQIELMVYAKNTKAISFYRRNGFALCDKQQACPHTGEIEHCMTWSSKACAHAGPQLV